MVRAAGGVLWRRGPSGALEVVLVHRPRYDDWSLPKGKLEEGEREEDAAVREVREETRLTGRLGPQLGLVAYTDRFGRDKTVRYWAMTVVSGDAGGDHEVDQAVWLNLPEALERLSYPRDRAVLEALAQLGEVGELG